MFKFIVSANHKLLILNQHQTENSLFGQILLKQYVFKTNMSSLTGSTWFCLVFIVLLTSQSSQEKS